MPDSTIDTYSISQYFFAVLSFPGFKLVITPSSHPFAKISNIQQISTEKMSHAFNFIEASKYIYQQQGIKGFFVGTVARTLTEVSRSCFKGPFQVFAYDQSKEYFDNSFLRSLTAGTMIAAFELNFAFAERYKVLKMENSDITFQKYLKIIYRKKTAASPFERAIDVIRNAGKGTAISTLRQGIMNTGFFYGKDITDHYFQPYQKSHPILTTFGSSLGPGLFAAALGAPLDVVKTLKQKSLDNNKSSWQILSNIVKTSGLKSLLAGLPAKFILIFFNYFSYALSMDIYKATLKASEPSQDARKKTSPLFQLSSTHFFKKRLLNCPFSEIDMDLEGREAVPTM